MLFLQIVVFHHYQERVKEIEMKERNKIYNDTLDLRSVGNVNKVNVNLMTAGCLFHFLLPSHATPTIA